MKKSPLREKSFQFAVEIILFYKHLINNEKEFVLSKQLVRSGTSIGAQIREAGNAESKKDFVHKLGISQKECDETLYWLELMEATDFIGKQDFEALHSKGSEIMKMLKSSILTTKSRMRK